MTQLLLGPGASLAFAPAADLEAAGPRSVDRTPTGGGAAEELTEARVPRPPKQPRAGEREEAMEEQRCAHVTAEQPDQACYLATAPRSGALNMSSPTRPAMARYAYYEAALTVHLLCMYSTMKSDTYTYYGQAAYVRCTWVWLHLARTSLDQGR